MYSQISIVTRLGLTTFLVVSSLPILVPSALADKVTASAAFVVDASGYAKAVSVGVAVGSNDSYSRSFYDPGTGNLSSIAIGSAGTIYCDGGPCNQPAQSAAITIGGSSGTDPVYGGTPPTDFKSNGP